MVKRVFNEVKYYQALKGVSLVGGDSVTVIGEQQAELDDGVVVDQYIYNIDGHTTANGLPFVARKENIIISSFTS